MNTPTKEQRDKIDRAIDTVTSICSSGSISPSKAIAKVASDMKLTADYLPIIVRAYNTGAATVHREDAHTLQEKAASYPIAYLDEVLSLLQNSFPMNKKASVEKPRDTFWEYNANYYFPDAWDHLVDTSDSSMWDVKQASVKRCTIAKDNLKKNVNNTAKRTADEATRIKYAAEEDKNKALSEVERVLCQNSGIKLATARQYASASYGKEGLAIIDKLIRVNNLEKTAQYRRETFIPIEHPFAKAFEDFVLKNEDFKKVAATERKVLEQCVNVLNESVRPKDRYMNNDESIDAMFKAGEMKRRKKDMYKPYQKKKEDFLKEAYRPLSESGVGGISGLEQLNHPGWVGLDRFERELMYGLADPAHEADLRNIRVQTILTDLMNTDPYLKDKDPEEVIDAMNDIMEINPDLHKNKPMLRIALRQFLESGGMDIPTLGVLSEFGKEERERKSREKSQRESAAQQFASQQESARQANEKLRSEEERARADRESKEQIAAKELDLKEREFAKKYPELEKEHKGLVRRLVSMGMSVGEIAHNIRHPRQAISEAFTREWERERRDRDLKSHEEDMELNKREAEQLHAANDVMDSTLRGDILQADMGRRAEILNRKQVKDWIDGVNLDRDQRKAVIDQLYANEDARAYELAKGINNEKTEHEHNNLADTLQSMDNEAKAKALKSKEELGKAQNRDAKLTEILTSDADKLKDQLAEDAQQHRHAPENLLMEDREHKEKLFNSNLKETHRREYEQLATDEAREAIADRKQALGFRTDDRTMAKHKHDEAVRQDALEALINEDPEVIAARENLAKAEAKIFAKNNTPTKITERTDRTIRKNENDFRIEGYGTTQKALNAKARAAEAQQQRYNEANSTTNTKTRLKADKANDAFQLSEYAKENSPESILARTNEADLARLNKQAPYTASRYPQTLANAQQKIQEDFNDEQQKLNNRSSERRINEKLLQTKGLNAATSLYDAITKFNKIFRPTQVTNNGTSSTTGSSSNTGTPDYGTNTSSASTFNPSSWFTSYNTGTGGYDFNYPDTTGQQQNKSTGTQQQPKRIDPSTTEYINNQVNVARTTGDRNAFVNAMNAYYNAKNGYGSNPGSWGEGTGSSELPNSHFNSGGGRENSLNFIDWASKHYNKSINDLAAAWDANHDISDTWAADRRAEYEEKKNKKSNNQ